MREAKIPGGLALAVIAIAAAGAVLFGTAHGVGLAHDSLEYVGAARSLLAGRGLYVLGEHGGLGPLTHFPPLTSLLLTAAGKIIGRDPLDAARWLYATLFGANVLLIGLMVRRCTRSPWFPPAASMLAALNPLLLGLHTTPCSEPLFFFLGFGSLLLISRYVMRPRILLLLAAAVAVALALVTRYPGIAFLGAAAFGVLRFGGGSVGSRMGRLVILGLIVSLPLGAWVMRNQQVEHRAAGREVTFHPLKGEKLKIGKETVESWVAPATPPHVPRKIVFELAVLGAIALGIFAMAVKRPAVAEAETGGRGVALRSMLVVYALLHAAILLVTMLFFDASIALDPRMLSPVYLAGIVLLAAAAERVAERGPGFRYAVAALALVVFASYLGASGPMVLQIHREPIEYASMKWQASPLLAAVRALPPQVPVYSNGPEGLWFITGREVIKLPGKLERMSDKPNAAYAQEITELRRRLRDENGAVAYFDNRHIIRYDLPTAEQLRRDLGDVEVREFADGMLFEGQIRNPKSEIRNKFK